DLRRSGLRDAGGAARDPARSPCQRQRRGAHQLPARHGAEIRLLRRQLLKRRELLHRAVDRAVQFGGEAGAPGGPPFPLGSGPQPQRTPGHPAACRRRRQLVPAPVARRRAFDQSGAEQRAQVACQGGAVGGQQLGQPPDRDRPFGADEAQQRELRDLQPGRREMLAVDLGDTPRRAAHAEAGAVERRKSGGGHDEILWIAGAPAKPKSCICTQLMTETTMAPDSMAPESGEAGFGVIPLEKARTMDALPMFQEMLAGRLPAPPIARALGFRMSEVELGRVVFSYDPVFEHYNPLGSIHGGIAATLLDSVMGCAIHSTLKAGNGFTTLEIKVNYVRAMTDKTGPVKAGGKISRGGPRTAPAGGRLVAGAGKLLAHGTTPCLISPI